MKMNSRVVSLFVLIWITSQNTILAQYNTPTLLGVPADMSVSKVFTRNTEVNYALGVETDENDLDLIEKYYLQPSKEIWTTFIGKTTEGHTVIVQKNHGPFTQDATLGYQISHIVTTQQSTKIYDYLNNLIRQTDFSDLAIDENKYEGETDSSDWTSVTEKRPGVTLYLGQGIEILEDFNTGNVSETHTFDNGDLMKIFSNYSVTNGQLGELNYQMTLIPIETPLQKCVTKIITEKYTYDGTGIEPRIERDHSGENENLTLSVSPNPVNHFLSLKINGYSVNNNLQYFILSSTGIIASSGQLSESKSQTIDVSSLTPGIYIIQIHGKGQVATEKFIKIAQ